jgi:serine phosphatase RsbU (regulator of sigma subunit)
LSTTTSASSEPPFTAREVLYRSRRVVVELGTWQGRDAVAKRSAGVEGRHGLRLQQEFRALERVHSPRVVRPLALVTSSFGPQLVLEHAPGPRLDQLELPLRPERFLPLAASIAEAVAAVHAAGMIHRDIKPKNLIATSPSEVVLLDFDLATASQRQSQSYVAAGRLEGTLAYLAPEQTGRTSRPLDYRADLYSLGCTFYFLLSGHPPFVTDDPLELLHRHLTAQPEPLAGVPAVLDGIVRKLLEKSAEDRYQSANGVLHDLARCRAELVSGATFELGARDMREQLTFPTKIYGREVAASRLADALRDATAGRTRVVFVHGYAGVGKTALVNELHRPLLAARGYYARGKFNQLQRDMPFAALSAAFSDVFDQVLAEDEATLAALRRRILRATGNEAQLLIDIIPAAARVLGTQPAVRELPPQDNEARVARLLRELVAAVCADGRPLVLFIDDLQWADLGTLRFFEAVEELQASLLLVGAYRDNEVRSGSPVLESIMRLSQRSATRIELLPLTVEVVRDIVGDTLLRPPASVADLADLLHQRTNGNPFFLHQLMTSLYDEGVIGLRSDVWAYDLEGARAAHPSANVVELLCHKLQRVPERVAELLELCACIGPRFELDLLASISGLGLAELSDLLSEAAAAGFVVQSGDRAFRFLHDRVQQAAFELLPKEQRAALHAKVGRRLLSPGLDGERLFVVAEHLHAAFSVLDDVERETLALLSLRAAERAHASSAFEAASRYASRCLAQTDPQRDFERFRRASALVADSQYSLGEYASAQRVLDGLLEHSEDVELRVATYRKKAVVCAAEGELGEAFGYFGKIAMAVGYSFNAEPDDEEVEGLIEYARQTIEELGLPRLDDLPRSAKPLADLLIESSLYFGSIAYVWNPLSFRALQSFTVIHAFESGVTPSTAPMLIAWSSCAGSVLGDHALARDIGLAGRRMSQAHSPATVQVKSDTMYDAFCGHYALRVDENVERLRSDAARAIMLGDIEYAGLARQFADELSVWFVGPQQNVLHALREDQRWARDVDSIACLHAFALLEDAIAQLRGQEVAGASEELRDAWARHLGPFGQARTYGSETITCLLLGDYARAAEAFERYLPLREHLAGALVSLLLAFGGSVASLRAGATPAALAASMQLVEGHAAVSRVTAPLAEALRAERARQEGDATRAQAHYELATELAEEQASPLISGLLCRLAAQLHVETGSRRQARYYAGDAAAYYERAGASALVEGVQTEFANIGLRTSAMRGQGTGQAFASLVDASTFVEGPGAGQALDLWSVVKATQALSAEIHLEGLIVRLMTLVCEVAGATRGVLLLPDGEQLRIAADRGGTGEGLSFDERVPREIVMLSARLARPVSIECASEDPAFQHNEYVRAHDSRSILCVPLEHGGEVRGLLYLENQLVRGVFTSDRVETLRILAGQAVISLDNARLVAEEAEKQRAEQDLRAAANIQAALVPRAPVMEGCELAAYMAPAAAVAGDYYDVIRRNDRDWIIIGDVTGHGLAAGLVMVMCQTALHTILNTQPDADPSQVLGAINRVLRANVERLRESKYMSATLLVREPDGRFRYAGLHEDLLIYRAATRTVERHDTSGMWLGMLPDIEGMLTTREVVLHRGDVLLLYTDGVTEARAREDGTMLQREGLMTLLARVGELPSQRIVDAVIKLLESHVVKDDVSLLAIKQS